MKKFGLLLVGLVLLVGMISFVFAQSVEFDEEVPDPNAPVSAGVVGCTGTAKSCNDLNKMTCGISETIGQIGCSWNDVSSVCLGTAKSCNDLDEMTCGISETLGQIGCFPAFGGVAGCSGTVSTICDDYLPAQCPIKLGCGVEEPLCVKKPCNVFSRRTCGDSESVGVPGCFWIKKTTPLGSRTFRYASWECQDGTIKEEGSEKVCRRYWSEWFLEHAAPFCLDHCAIEIGPNFSPKLANYCIISFNVSEECESGLFQKIMAWFKRLFGG